MIRAPEIVGRVPAPALNGNSNRRAKGNSGGFLYNPRETSRKRVVPHPSPRLQSTLEDQSAYTNSIVRRYHAYKGCGTSLRLAQGRMDTKHPQWDQAYGKSEVSMSVR